MVILWSLYNIQKNWNRNFLSNYSRSFRRLVLNRMIQWCHTKMPRWTSNVIDDLIFSSEILQFRRYEISQTCYLRGILNSSSHMEFICGCRLLHFVFDLYRSTEYIYRWNISRRSMPKILSRKLSRCILFISNTFRLLYSFWILIARLSTVWSQTHNASWFIRYHSCCAVSLELVLPDSSLHSECVQIIQLLRFTNESHLIV